MEVVKTSTSHIYIKEGASKAEQRTGLNMMLTMNYQLKAENNIMTNGDVMNIADTLLIFDMNMMPPAHVMAQALAHYKIKGSEDIEPSDLAIMIRSLSGDAFNASTSTSPARAIPRKLATAQSPKGEAQTETESDSDSQVDEEQSYKKTEVNLKVPTEEEEEAMVSRLRARVNSTSSSGIENEADLLKKLVERINKLNREDLLSIFQYYRSQRPTASKQLRNEWNSAQTRAATAIRDGLHASFHSYLSVPTAGGSIDTVKNASIQGSLFIKCLVTNILGRGETAIIRQRQQAEAAIETYGTATDMLQYSLTVRAEVTWYNKCFRYNSLPQMQKRTEHEFMEHILREVFKQQHQKNLAKQLRQRLDQGTMNLEDLLLQLREDRQLEERLHASVTSLGNKDSGDADDKKGKQRKSTANQASQNKVCSVCGENHDVSQCPQEEARLNRDAYQRGNRMPGQASSNLPGRNGRGGFGGGRGRGRGAGGSYGGRGGGSSGFGGARQDSAPQQDGEKRAECFKCVALGHKGKYAEHSVDMCPHKAMFESYLQDPRMASRMMQRLNDRNQSARSDNSRGGSNAVSMNKQSSGNFFQGHAPDHVHAPVPLQQIQPSVNEYRSPQQPTGEYRYPPNPSFVQPWQLSQSSMGSAGAFSQQPFAIQRQAQAHLSQANPNLDVMGDSQLRQQYMQTQPGFQIGPPGQQPSNASSTFQGGQPNSPERRSGMHEGTTAQTAISSRVIGPEDFERRFRQHGNLLVSNQGDHCIIYSGSIPTAEETDYKPIAMTATRLGEGNEYSSSWTMDHDRPSLAENAFGQLPLWLVQRIAMGAPDPTTLEIGDVQQMIDIAHRVLVERMESNEELTYDIMTGILGHVDASGQCLMYTISTLTGQNVPPRLLRRQFLDSIRQSPESLIGLDPAHKLMYAEYKIDIQSEHQSSIEALATFCDRYEAGDFQSGVVELLWAAQRANKHLVIVSNVEGFPWSAVTGIIPDYENPCSEVEFISAGKIELAQLDTKMILYTHGAMLNPYVVSQLTHFAPIQSVGRNDIELGDRLDVCIIVQNPDVRDLENLSLIGHIRDLTDIDCESVLAAKAMKKRQNLDHECDRIRERVQKRLTFTYVLGWKEHMFTARLIATQKFKQQHVVCSQIFHNWRQCLGLSESFASLECRRSIRTILSEWRVFRNRRCASIMVGQTILQRYRAKKRQDDLIHSRSTSVSPINPVDDTECLSITKHTSSVAEFDTTQKTMIHYETVVEPHEEAGFTVQINDESKSMQVIVHPHFQEEHIISRSFSALRKRCLRPLCRQVFNALLRQVHKVQVGKFSRMVLLRRVFTAYKNASGVRKRSVLRRVYTQVGMKCMFAYWSSYYKYTFVPQRLLAQRLVDLNNRLRLLQPAIQHWKKFVQQSLPPSSPNFLGARRSFVDSSVLRERLLNLQKLQTLFLEWKLAVEADKLLPDVNHLVLCNITAKDKFRKSTRYEELKRKLRVLLVTLRQSRMTKFAQAYLRRLKEMFERKTAARQLVVPAMQAVAHGGMHAGIFFGINFYRVICVSGSFVFNLTIISIYAAGLTGIKILLTVAQLCIYAVYYSTILFSHVLQQLIVPNRGEYAAAENDLPQSEASNIAVAMHATTRVAMPATQIIRSQEMETNAAGFTRRLSLVDTGTDSYLRRDTRSMRSLVNANVRISTAGPEEIQATQAGLLSMIVRDKSGNMHELKIERALVVPNLSKDLTSHLQFVENGHTVFFHKSGSGILLNAKPRFAPDDVIIPFFTGPNGLQYLQEFVPVEDRAVAMVGGRLSQLSEAEITHISLSHPSPTIMKRLHLVATDIPKHRHLNFKCHCCVEAKMKHKPKPPRSIRVITFPGQVVSVDMVGPFKTASIHGCVYGLIFLEHYTNTPFPYALVKKSEYPKYLKKFFVDFRELFADKWKVQTVRVLRSDNAQELQSREVQKIAEEERCALQHSSEYEQWGNGKAEKCVGDCWSMTRTSLIFSQAPRKLWDYAWKNSGVVKRHLPCSANIGFQSPLQMIYGEKRPVKHLLPFGCLMYVVLDKDVVADWKFDPRAGACVYLGSGELDGRKCVLGYTIDFNNKGRMGKVVHSTQYWADPTYFPFRKAGEERVTSLSIGSYLSGKEAFQQEIPLPPCYEEWINASKEDEQQEQQQMHDKFQNAEATPIEEPEAIDPPERTEIVGYDKTTGQYALRSAGVTTYVDASEMFERLNNNEVIYVEGSGAIPKMTLWYGEDDEVFMYEGSDLFVEKITVNDFNDRLEEIFATTKSKKEYDSIRENIQKIIMEQLIREDQEKMSSNEVFQDTGSYNKAYSFTALLAHDEYPETAAAYAAKVKNPLGSDDLTLAEALEIKEEVPMWKEAIRVELTSLIQKRNVFKIVTMNEIPTEHRSKIYNLMILLKRKRNQFREISKYKCRLVMDGSRQKVGIDVFDTFAPVIDYSTVRLLISTAFGNGWEMYHWDISVAFTNADSHEPTYVRFPKNFPDDICPGYTGGTLARLTKNLYGSKSAPKWWYKCLYQFLIEIGFKSVAGHPCLLIRCVCIEGELIIVVIGIFVDDLLVTGNSRDAVEHVKKLMGEKFEFTDQGRLEYYLGVEVTQVDEYTLLLHQSGYIQKMLETFKMADSKPVSTPLPLNLDLSLKDSPDQVDPDLQEEYRAIVGSLMFLYQWTRPDLGFAVTFLSRYLHKPGVKHLQAAKHTLRYVKGTLNLGIKYTRDLNRLRNRGHDLNVLYGLSDSDFAGCKDTAKSTSGYVVLLNGGPIAYYSGRQSTVALCTAMAETIALAKLVVKIKHLRALMHDLQCCQNRETKIESTIVWVDNTAALAVATGNDFTHETVKHVTVKVRFLQECVQHKIIRLTYVATRKNVSDMMTKQSNGPQFKAHRDFVLGYADDVVASAPFAGVAVRRRRRGCRVRLLRV